MEDYSVEPERFFGSPGSPINGLKISFSGSISVHKLEDNAEQEEKGDDCKESVDSAHCQRLRRIARLEGEIRDLEMEHRLKVDELSQLFED
ncbi:hypothetical protein TELCIR_08972 [Teladorsagia circumcincta]|uniref:Uncharacterized protein n=1 Tax=Teladorsagia circumcincta TaxID=45464 RepID=A0A2G9UG30_TELCI|nr:hypothetical protein TELCIR_08972 [Teladorsagia circumcincta]